jgi:hypothetical protein
MCGRTRAAGWFWTISVTALLATAAALAMAGPASATVLEYTFNAGNEGWQQAQDPANGPFVPATFQSSGGNPGGHLSTRDSGAETGCPDKDPCQLLTYYSPFVSPLGANYGGTGAFDLRSSVTPQFGAELLLLPQHGRDYLDGLIPASLGAGYHRLSIRLDQTGNWAVCPYAGGSCSPPSQATFQALIEDSDEFAVIVDVGANGTGETYDLDNVSLTNGGPQPPPPPPPNKNKNKNKKKCKRKHHRAASAKKHKCKKKKKKRRASLSALRG